MTIIEGVGDEVTQFFVIVSVILVAVIAWWSTSISEQPLIRTVLILERRTRQRVETPPVGSVTESNSIDTGQEVQDSRQEENRTQNASEECKENLETPESSSHSGLSSDISVVERNSDSNVLPNESKVESDLARASSSFTSVSQDETTDQPDLSLLQTALSNSRALEDNSHSCLIRQRRLVFFGSRHSQQESNDDAMRQETLESESVSHQQLSSEEVLNINSVEHLDPAREGNIRIRLMYLNDTQKLVSGRLEEQLGDFKRRHFGVELAANKLVRLIFNGQVLESDSETLQHYGLFDNCVVHCLVHQHRSHELHNSTFSTEARDWDLGSLLFIFLSVILGLAWYGRYHYSQFFTTATTVALVGLTGIFVVSLVGVYLPDQDGVRQ